MSAELHDDLKKLIVERLNLTHLKPEAIDDQTPLFNTGLGLDSIDALELVVSIEKAYGIKIANSEQAREAFQSVAALASFIKARQPTTA